jgi:predicted O-methyltransferase YrrM
LIPRLQRPPIVIADIAVNRAAIQKPLELTRFLEFLVEFGPQVMVEIGSHTGGTLWAWRQVVPTVIGIDLHPNFYDDSVIVGDSHSMKTVLALTKRLGGRAIDCLFIDGDHSYNGVRQDYIMYAPLVRPGGLIAFHDIAPILPGQTNVDDIQTKQFWDEIKDETAIEIIDTQDHLRSHIAGYGIGVLRHGPHTDNT